MRTIPFILAAALLTASACRGETERPDGGMGMLGAGAKAPTLKREAHNGKIVDLTALEGPTVIYFYPRDGTPGCTVEACAFRDVWAQYEAAGVQIVGVSADDLESHRAFANKHDLPFPLVADEDLSWAKAFGVGTMGPVTRRVSFLLASDGTIVKAYPSVDPGIHADDVLRDAENIAR